MILSRSLVTDYVKCGADRCTHDEGPEGLFSVANSAADIFSFVTDCRFEHLVIIKQLQSVLVLESFTA